MLILPFVPSVPDYDFSVTIEDTAYRFRARWNARERYDTETDTDLGAWIIDASEIDGTPIFRGVKLTLGTYLGRQYNHPLTRGGVIVAHDTESRGRTPARDAGFDDLGTRVIVLYIPAAEVVFGILATKAEIEAV